MKAILLFLITVFSVTAQAQVSLQISDQESNENVEFATILLPDYKKSFVADEHGKFIIDTNKYKLPLKVLIEQLGFESKEITLQNNTKVYNIYLNPSSELLREIIIPPANAKIKERTYGRKNEGNSKIIFSPHLSIVDDNNVDNIFGLILNTNNHFKKINKINWFINDVSFEKAIFNLQFYQVINNKPSKKIVHNEINFTINSNTKGWLALNVEDLNIYIDGTKKIAAILKPKKIEFKKGTKEATIKMNANLTSVNFLTIYNNKDNKWETGPMNFPFYITVESYE